MQINVELSLSHGRLSKREPFILTKNDPAELVFKSKQVLDEFIVTIKNGDTEGTYKATGGRFVVPEEFCFAGTLNMFIALTARGETVKSWTVEPIILKELSAGFEGHPEFEDIKAKMEAIANEMAVLRALGVRWEELKTLTQNLKTLGEGHTAALEGITKILSGYNPIP